MPDLDALLTRSFALAAPAAEGDHPFGALPTVDGEIAAEALNRVNTDGDLTAHLETVLVRELGRGLRLLAATNFPRGLVRAGRVLVPRSGRALTTS